MGCEGIAEFGGLSLGVGQGCGSQELPRFGGARAIGAGRVGGQWGVLGFGDTRTKGTEIWGIPIARGSQD